MAENKTKPTIESVTAFLNKIQDTQLREDCFAILEIMESVSKTKPVMWGSSIIGFGTYHYVYESGREGDMVIIGFSPRKQNISVYLKGGLDQLQDELSELGKHKIGKGCLYIKTLKDINTAVFRKMLSKAFKSAKQK
ncbi:MAG: DUF1801 domain-containing protein [bacterium]